MPVVDTTTLPVASPRQRDAVCVIRTFRARHGESPTVRELGKGLGGISPPAVFELLAGLERKGYLRRTPHAPRGLVLLPRARGIRR